MEKEQGGEKFSFSVKYEFEQSRLGEEIFWQVSKDFNVAQWMEKFYECSEEANNLFTVDVVDIRQLKKSKNQKESEKIVWEFLGQDRGDDTRIYECLS